MLAGKVGVMRFLCIWHFAEIAPLVKKEYREKYVNMDKMDILFKYFEDAEEMVYAADMGSDELVYMNGSLRAFLGYRDREAYKGMKCYQVLQGMDAPCDFCNNEALLSGGFQTWAHENPVLNQRLIIRDKILECDGRRYRVGVWAEQNQSGLTKAEHYLTRRESVLNECLQIFFNAPDPEKSLEGLLRYLGQNFRGDRAYLFEIDEEGTTSNTYEWNAPKVTPQKELLQNIPISDIRYWIQGFNRGDIILIRDLEEIHRDYPAVYSLLKPQGIRSLMAGPIQEGGKLKGFIGLDNPDEQTLSLLEQVLRELGKYMIPQLKRRDLYQRFTQMSYHDMLTGAYNHNAMLEHTSGSETWRSFGAVYCDINGLKETNNTQGHDAGNHLIQECCRLMRKTLHTEWIYRVGGDEFVALYRDTDRHLMEKDMDALRLAILQSTCQVSIGSAWSDETPINMEQILDQAYAEMSREKNLYYAMMEMDKTGATASEDPGLIPTEEEEADSRQLVLRRFLSNAYCDMAFLLSVLGDENKTSYFFFGDMQQSVYYISENMRVKFGFTSNIISDLIHVWASRIEDPEILDRFWRDIDALLRKKQKYHDLRYQVYDANENKIWIRCYGQVKWSEDGTIPLFFAGRISQQDEDFVVDPLTNFPTESVLIKELERLQNTKGCHEAIGFSLHHITQINNNYGRDYGDNLICEITRKLSDTLSHEATFFRLSGMRFLGMVESHSQKKAEELISEIREMVDEYYHHMGVTLPTTCSFVLLHYPQDGMTPQDFVESAISLMKAAHQTPGDQMFLDDSQENIQKIKQVANMESRLMENILHGMEEFRIVVQPVVSAETGLPVGGETLLRWRFDGENVSPGLFIPIIERENMIHMVGRWVFEQAVRACVRLTTLMPDFYLTVNVSLQQLDDDGLVDFIRQTLKKYKLEGKHIVLELTESCMDSQPEKLETFVQDCTQMGLRIALDDFGSGYSSLRVLLRYPSNIIKLDRSLLLEMSDSMEKSSFITSIVYACHQFGKKVCMEGVETAFQKDLVKQAGCDLIQGFYCYKPMELDGIYQLIGRQNNRNAGREEISE